MNMQLESCTSILSKCTETPADTHRCLQACSMYIHKHTHTRTHTHIHTHMRRQEDSIRSLTPSVAHLSLQQRPTRSHPAQPSSSRNTSPDHSQIFFGSGHSLDHLDQPQINSRSISDQPQISSRLNTLPNSKLQLHSRNHSQQSNPPAHAPSDTTSLLDAQQALVPTQSRHGLPSPTHTPLKLATVAAAPPMNNPVVPKIVSHGAPSPVQLLPPRPDRPAVAPPLRSSTASAADLTQQPSGRQGAAAPSDTAG